MIWCNRSRSSSSSKRRRTPSASTTTAGSSTTTWGEIGTVELIRLITPFTEYGGVVTIIRGGGRPLHRWLLIDDTMSHGVK